MSQDWIKIETALPDKPEVMQLANLLGISEMEVVGHLVKFWGWVDKNMSQKCPKVFGTKSGIDSRSGRTGFCDAMIAVGWLKFDGQQIEIPNYEHHLSQSAKQRAFDAKRKRGQRVNVPESVGQMSQKSWDKNGTKGGTREEKRREEKDIAIPNGIACSEPPLETPEPPVPAKVDDSPVVMVFPVTGKVREWPLRQAFVETLQRAYETLRVVDESKRALAWCEANPAKRKTFKGMSAFLQRWMDRAANSPQRPQSTGPPRDQSRFDWMDRLDQLPDGST